MNLLYKPRVDEVERAIGCLHNGKATGISNEHLALHFGGSMYIENLDYIDPNATLLLGCIPSSFKAAYITPTIILTKEREKIPLSSL